MYLVLCIVVFDKGAGGMLIEHSLALQRVHVARSVMASRPPVAGFAWLFWDRLRPSSVPQFSHNGLSSSLM